MRTVIGAGEYAWDEEEPLPQRRRRVRLPVVGKAEPLEPDHQIVGEQRLLGVHGVGEEPFGGRLRVGEIVPEYADDPLEPHPPVIEVKHAVRGEIEIRDDDAIGITVELQEFQLPAPRFGQALPHDDEPVRPRPSVRLVAELRRGFPAVHPMIAESGQAALDWHGEVGHHDESNAVFLQFFNEFRIVEAGIGTDAGLPYACGNDGKHFIKHVQCPRSA